MDDRLNKRALANAAKAIEDFCCYDTSTPLAEDCIRAYLAALPEPARAGEAVAWRVKDYADGWIFFAREGHARSLAEKTGALFEPLFAAPAPTVSAGVDELFDLSVEAIERLRSNGLKPDEISGEKQAARVKELLHWFARLAAGEANPKWTRSHAFEMAYYIATTKLYPAPTREEVLEEIAAERRRQIEAEGWTPEHDDTHDKGELAAAAASYATARWRFFSAPTHEDSGWEPPECPKGWPWHRSWWKPKEPRHNLIRAAALIIAEIERLDRRALARAKP